MATEKGSRRHGRRQKTQLTFSENRVGAKGAPFTFALSEMACADRGMKAIRYDFTSDNTAAICPEAWAALEAANVGAAPSYGADAWTARAAELVRSVFETDCEVFFVSTGTAANALALAAGGAGGGAILCHESAHILRHEERASAFFSGGAEFLPLAGAAGKCDPAALERALAAPPAPGSAPRVLSLTQSTELGTVYSAAETRGLAAAARSRGLRVHMDGARFAVAAAALAGSGASPADLAWRAGIDVLSFGGIKNGLAEAEAVVFFDRSLARGFSERQIRAGQRSSKMRFQAAQWIALLEHGAWLQHARHANAMARRLGEALSRLPGVELGAEVQTSAVFVRLPPTTAAALRSRGWDVRPPGPAGHRLRCSWAIRPEDVDAFAADAAAASAA
jgi:threonine aldolase